MGKKLFFNNNFIFYSNKFLTCIIIVSQMGKWRVKGVKQPWIPFGVTWTSGDAHVMVKMGKQEEYCLSPNSVPISLRGLQNPNRIISGKSYWSRDWRAQSTMAVPVVKFPIFLLVRIIGIVVVTLVVTWTVRYRGGLALVSDNKDLIFNVIYIYLRICVFFSTLAYIIT